MKITENLLSELTQIKENKNFDYGKDDLSDGITKGFNIEPVNLKIYGYELSDFDKAIELINMFTSGKRRNQLLSKYNGYRQSFIDGNDNHPKINDRAWGFFRQLKEDLKYRKHWETTKLIDQQVDCFYPKDKISILKEIEDLAQPLFFISFAKKLYEKSIENFNQVDLKKIKTLMALSQEETNNL